MKSKLSKVCDISQKTRQMVWDRDQQQCIFCGSSIAVPNAHVIPRSKMGMGIEQNVVTACIKCHHLMDNSVRRPEFVEKAKEYLFSIYGEVDVIYRKGMS